VRFASQIGQITTNANSKLPFDSHNSEIKPFPSGEGGVKLEISTMVGEIVKAVSPLADFIFSSVNSVISN
jgi:hypothetical protein